MYKNQFFKTLFSSLIIAFSFGNVAYAEITYQGIIEKGEALLSVNDKQAKRYKQGETIKLVADDLVCLRSGEGVVVIFDGAGVNFKETLSIPLQCQSTPQDKEAKGWFSNAKKEVVEVDKEGMPEALRSKLVTTSLIELDGVEYFVLENSSWHTNKNTL